MPLSHRTNAVTVDERLGELAAEYMRLIGPLHHKDRDCHWYVEKRWSYGEGPMYRAQHAGYCVTPWADGEGPDRKTYAGAATDLLLALESAVEEARTWDE